MPSNAYIGAMSRWMFIVLMCCAGPVSAQYATKKVSKRKQAYTDSLKQVSYNYTFPIWGQKVYQRGFDIPYPAGVMGNYIWMDQGILIDNMQLGLETDNVDIPLTPVDFIEFGENRTEVRAVNIRPDLWIFPFLGVYGIFGAGSSTTTVRLTSPIPLTSIVTQNVRTGGFGIIGAFGVGPVWVSLDGNWTWSKPELLDDPVLVRTFGTRIGHTFTFRNRPDRNFALWVGGMRVRMQSETRGQIKLQDALPPDTWDRIDDIVNDYWSWYNSLNPNNPIDARKIQIADQILTPIVDRLENRDGDAIIRYGLDKAPTQEWNMVIGGQFQLNKRWQFRTEFGIIGDRESWLASVNYRFLL